LIKQKKGGRVRLMEHCHSDISSGILYLVATPIGNLEDITLRALRVLKEVDLIAAEDTRRTKKLLNHYQIATPVTSYFEHSSVRKTHSLIAQLKGGKQIALVSEAGTPSISDPGFTLTTQAIEHQIRVTPIPGPSALTAALSASGLPTHSFVFEGFVPRKAGKRKSLFVSLKGEIRTLILYESPRRVTATLRDLLTVLGERKIVIVRELTKMFEEIIRGNLSEVLAQLEGKTIKGEVTLVVSGTPSSPPPGLIDREQRIW
jgi:16S rRNA (cytidine1402-2'-O)-methyltransferase